MRAAGRSSRAALGWDGDGGGVVSGLVRQIRWVLVAVAVGGAVVMVAPAAQAACHAFTVSAEPAQVAEGGKVTVTVTRDAGVNPSQVDVSSVDVTAKGGEDYPAQKRTVSYTAETQQSFEIPVTDDAVSEGAETFRLHLSNPGGCAVNSNFSVGPDATVTILASDASGTTTTPTAAPTAPPTTRPPGSTTTADDTTTVPTSASPSAPAGETEDTSSTTTTLADEAGQALPSSESDDEDDGGGGLVAAAALAVAALGGAGYVLYRRRQSASG